jgi:phenylpropionate dioxygenase-like ring-hydroxylating dioxygenase large terminal subunit
MTVMTTQLRFAVFANPAATSRSWFPAARSARLKRGAIRRFQLGARRIAVYRDANGAAHAIDARCAHLGADLAEGSVAADGIRCAFHGWCFGADGISRDAPGHETPPRRAVRAYPCVERWGAIWIFNGTAPLFELPSTDPATRYWSLTLPAQRIRCHPHIVLANGLDVSHYDALHGMTLAGEPRLEVGEHTVAIEMRGRPRSRFWQFVSGSRRADIVARFETVGGSVAWTTVSAPVHFHVLFTGTPDADGHCVTHTTFLFPAAVNMTFARGLGMMATLLHDDRRVLDGIDFRPDFHEHDAPLRAFAGVVEALGAW